MSTPPHDAPDPTAIGEISAPPFVKLPDPTELFVARTLRLRHWANGSELSPYLQFVATVTELQYRIQDGLPEPRLPSTEAVERARTAEMPPLDVPGMCRDEAFLATVDAMAAALSSAAVPEAAALAAKRLQTAAPGAYPAMIYAVLRHGVPAESVAEHVVVAAAMQVHAARCASRLAPDHLVPVAEGACPCCGSPPSATMVVGWQGAYGSRFCFCSLCGTLWNYVRIKCVLCGSTKGIGYQELDGGSGTCKAETCDSCHRYVKVFYQTKDHQIEPLADDVATLGLDMLMASSPYRRGGINPFLAGY